MGLKGFIKFVREQGVVGLAVGFILGGAISAVVASLVTDIINPLISGVLSNTQQLYITVGTSKIAYGSFLGSIINFAIIALVVYNIVRFFHLDTFDEKKNK
ncbi:MAG: MscL family protein [bacterium]